MKNYRYRIFQIFYIGIILLSGLAACNPSIPTETALPEISLTASPEENATETPPTLTPTQTEEAVILMTSPNTDPLIVSRVRESLEILAADSGFKLAVQEGSSVEMMTNTPVVVTLGEDIDVNNLAASYPEVSFVAIDNTGAAPSANLSVIGDSLTDQKRRAFMAGYLAALLSEDYKVAALAPSDSDVTEAVLESFVVGVRFFCGICQTKYPPYQSFPQWETLPANGSAETFQPVLDSFTNIGVEIFYVHGDLLSPQLLTAIADSGTLVIGDQHPDTIRNNYAGTILSDPVPMLEVIWADVLDGNSGQQIAGSIVLVDRNPDLISDGRYQFFLEMADDLQAGLIYPEAVP
jgi:hypothetical protein